MGRIISSLTPGRRRGAGPVTARTLACASVIFAAGLGLAACVGPYGDDGYGYSQNRDRHGTAYDPGYDQRRSGAYRQDPMMGPDQRPSNYGWWYGNPYPRDRRDD